MHTDIQTSVLWQLIKRAMDRFNGLILTGKSYVQSEYHADSFLVKRPGGLWQGLNDTFQHHSSDSGAV